MDFSHLDRHEDSQDFELLNLPWRRSSFCGTGACVEVIREGDIVVVRDSKLGDDSKTSEWDRNEWVDLIDAIKYGRDHQNILEEEVGSWFGGLWFTAEEWTAFVKGVKAGEFGYDRLSTPSPDSARQVPEEAVPVGTGSGLAATGAGEDTSTSPVGRTSSLPDPAPVAAASSAEEHRKQAEEMLASAHDADADADPVDVALVLQFAQTHALLSIAASLAPWPDDLEPPAGVPLKDDADEPLRLGAAPLVPVDENTGAQ